MLTVLMATYNGAPTLPKVLEAYTHLQAPAQGWRLVVVDNGSTDNTRAVLDSYAGRLPLTCLFEARRGKNVALNCALGLALESPGGLLVFTDDDASPAPDWLCQLADAALAQPGHDIFGGAITADWAEPPPPWLLALVPLGLTYGITEAARSEGPVFAGLVWGANMAIRGAVFEQGVRFDESVGPAAGSYAMGGETELTRRLAAQGHQCWFCPQARVAHHIRARQMTLDWTLQRAWRFGRSRFWQDPPGAFPELFGVPRWMFKSLALELAGLASAWAQRLPQQAYLHRWELSFIGGYLHQAWRSSGRRGKTHVLITSYSGELGGMELRMAQEARFLQAGGYTATLALRKFPGRENLFAQLRTERLPFASLTVPPFFEEWRWRRTNKWRAALHTSVQLRRQRPDLVHVAFCWNSYGASALWLARHCRLPAVISVHNAFPPAEFSDWHRPLLRDAFSTVRGVYAVSRSALEHFICLFDGYLPAGVRTAVIPNCVDTVRFCPGEARRLAARTSWGIPRRAQVIGSVGRLSAQKRPQSLLALAARIPDAYLVLVGSGPLERELRRTALAMGIGDRVVFAGFQAQVEEIMPAFDVHVLWSQREGFGISTVEAMACGVPVVASDVPGSADVLQGCDGGLLLPPDDEIRLAREVKALLSDPERCARMGRAGRAAAEQRFGVETVQAQIHAFYRGLI